MSSRPSITTTRIRLQNTFERMAREWSVRYLVERVAWCRVCLKSLDGWEGSV